MTLSTSKLAIPTQTAVGLLLIAGLTCLLYIPFLENALVFDDHNLFTSLVIYDYAANPFNLTPRSFPYFTLGFTEVMWKSMEVHRSISLLLHLSNAFLIYRLFARWLKEIGHKTAEQSNIAALSGSLFFAIHPVAVYGAGYLAQRTILFATFFSLLALWFYWRGLVRNKVADSVTAALFYSLAIYSKEHAIMLPAAALLLTGLAPLERSQKKTKAITFAALCIPAAVFVVLRIKGVIGTPYEPDAGNFASVIPVEKSQTMQWLLSIVTQSGLFFKYGQYWLWPDVQTMSADMRIDFASGWTPAWIALKLTGFTLFASTAGVLLRRKGIVGIAGWGMLYCWLLFATELVTIRFQEPFVLYRSYLWAPGMVIAVTIGLTYLMHRVPIATKVAAAILVTIMLFALSENRLSSLANDRTLWADAAEKITSTTAPGVERIFYNRGIQSINNNLPKEGVDDMNKVISLRPDIFQGYLGRAKAYQKLGKHELALSDFDRVINIISPQGNRATQGNIEYDMALSLLALNRTSEAEVALSKAADQGHIAAKAIIDHGIIKPMNSPNQ